MLIKNTKLAEERQSIALVGKRTIEDLENVIAENSIPQKDIKNYKITKSGDKVAISDLNFLRKEETNNKKLELVKLGDNEAYSGKLSLDSNYNFCDVSGKECVYQEEIKIEKAKSKKQGTGTGESKAEDDINIDKDDLDEDAEEVNEKINTIDNEFSMVKKQGADSESVIKSHKPDSTETTESTISSSDDFLTLNVWIDKDGKVSIKDGKQNTCVGTISNKLDDKKVNHLNLHFNFKEYLKGKDEKLKDLNINVYNEMVNTSKNVVSVYIEKSVDLIVRKKSKTSNSVRFVELDENKEITKVGPLYNIQVKIVRKEDSALLEKEQAQLTSGEKAKILFTGYSNKNIEIK